MNKHPLFLTLLFLAFISIMPSSSWAKETDSQSENINTLDDILGPITKDYVTQDRYKKVKGNYYKIRLLSDYEPGLSKNMWKGSSAKAIIEKLNQFNGVNGSPALRELWRTALLDGFNGASSTRKYDIDLAVARMETMMKLGLFHDAIRFYHAIDTSPIPDVIASKAVDAMALAGMVDAACLEVTFVTQSVRTPTWLKKRSLCAAHDGNTTMQKEIDLYLKDDLKDDLIHKSVARLLNKKTVDGPVKTSLSPLQRTLLLAHGGTVSHTTLNKADATFLASAVISPYLSLQKRLKAADKAADLGVISPQNLLAIYEKVQLSNEQIASARTKLLNGDPVSGATILTIITKTHDPEQRAQLIEKALKQNTYRTNTKNQLLLKYVDKISSQSDNVPSFAKTGYSLAIWQDYFAASKAFAPRAKETHSLLEAISDIKMPSDTEVDALLSFIEKQHPKTHIIRKERVLAALKALKFVKDDKIDNDLLKKWRKDQKNIQKKGISFLDGLQTLSFDKTGLSAPKTIYQALEKNNKNHFFEENRKIILEIIIQSVL